MKLTFEEFKEYIREELSRFYQEQADVQVRKVMKNNGLCLTGISLSSDKSNLSPTVYLESYYYRYCRGESLEDMFSDIVMTFEKNALSQGFDVGEFLDFEKAGKRIFYKLVSFEKNRELLKEVPHRRVMDLAMLYAYSVSSPEMGNGSVLIRNEHMKRWESSEEELHRIAAENTPRLFEAKLCSMLEMLEDCGKNLDLGLFQDNLYVLSNVSGINGAACMLYPHILEMIGDKIQASFYLLPSSVHELIIVSGENDIYADRLLEMVREVNGCVVSLEEILSDNIYFYSREDKELNLITA